jgi:hypothetical protein
VSLIRKIEQRFGIQEKNRNLPELARLSENQKTRPAAHDWAADRVLLGHASCARVRALLDVTLLHGRGDAHFAEQVVAVVDGVEQPVDVANVGVDAARDLWFEQPV